MTPARYGTYTEHITLPQTGTISLTFTDVNPMELDYEQRSWMFELIDLFHQFDAPDEPDTEPPTVGADEYGHSDA